MTGSSRRHFLIAASSLVLLIVPALPFRLLCAEPAKVPNAAAEPPEVDILKQVQEINTGKFPQPATDFRQGHVTPRKLDPAIVQKTKDGFRIKLPSGAPVPTLTVHDGKLYASGGFHSREFYCFNAATGEPIWAVDLDDDGPTSAVYGDGEIIFNTESCTIFSLDAETGKMLWSWFLGDPLMTTPTISGGRVYTSYPAAGRFAGQKLPEIEPAAKPAGQAAPKQSEKEQPAKTVPMPAPTHVLACFDLKTGKILWQRWIDSDVMSAPVAVDNDLYVASFSGTLYRFRQADGVILSAKQARATSAPIVVGKDIFFTRRAEDSPAMKPEEAMVRGDRETSKVQSEAVRKAAPHLDARVQAGGQLSISGTVLDASNGFAAGAPVAANAGAATFNIGKGSVSTLQAHQGSRVLNVGNTNFSCIGDELFCTDAVSCKVAWSMKLEGDMAKEGGALAAPPAAAGGQIFLATLKGDVLQLEPGKKSITHRYPVGTALRFQPTIQDGRIYVGTQDGQVVCIDTGDKKLTGWSTWGGNSAHTGIRGEPGK